MAVILSFTSDSEIALRDEINPYITTDIESVALVNPSSARDAIDVTYGALITSWPVEANGVAISAFRLNSYNDDFYFRIHVTPLSTDVGNLIGNREVHVRLWNAYFEPKTIDFMSSSGTDGISITTGLALPYEMKPMEEVEYVFTVTPDGPALIDATYEWSIEGETYSTKITGKRFVVFPFKPNYKNTGPVETFEWKTQIITKKTGSEQRISERLKPRRNFSYQMMAEKFDSQLLKHLVWGWMNRSYVLPIWTDARFTQSANAIGSTIIYFTTTNYNFVVGASLILYAASNDYEVVEIKEVYSDRVVTKTALLRAWAKDTEVYPLVLGHLPRAISLNRRVGDVLETTIAFDTDPATTSSSLPVLSAVTTYDGLEVITIQPNWIRDVADEYSYQFDTIDNQTGPRSWYPTETFAKSLRNYSWLLKTRTEISDFKGFLSRMNGRLKTCWVPSWAHDFDLAETITPANPIIKVADNGFLKLVGVNTAHDRLMIALKNGTIFYRRIITAGADAGGILTLIELDSALGVTAAAADIDYISYMDRCRFASDSVDVVWYTAEVAVVQLNLLSVLK